MVPFLLSSNQYDILWDLYGESLMNAPEQSIELTPPPEQNSAGSSTSSEFIPSADCEYWLFVVACHKKFGFGVGIKLTLNPKTPEEMRCDLNLANIPQSLSCRVLGLKKGQKDQVVLDQRPAANNATISYNAIATHNKLAIQTQASRVMDYNYRKLTGPAYLYN
jgi:hypothetical protein